MLSASLILLATFLGGISILMLYIWISWKRYWKLIVSKARSLKHNFGQPAAVAYLNSIPVTFREYCGYIRGKFEPKILIGKHDNQTIDELLKELREIDPLRLAILKADNL